MYRKTLLFNLCLLLTILTACSGESYETIKDKTYLIEDIRFEDGLVYIDTEEETLVFYRVHLDFYKTTEPSNINLKVLEASDWYNVNWLAGGYKTKKVNSVYINKKLVKDISKEYANVYERTLLFNE